MRQVGKELYRSRAGDEPHFREGLHVAHQAFEVGERLLLLRGRLQGWSFPLAGRRISPISKVEVPEPLVNELTRMEVEANQPARRARGHAGIDLPEFGFRLFQVVPLVVWP